MHLIRLLISGITLLREARVPVRVDEALREKLLTIKRGEMPWEQADAWRIQLHIEFDAALVTSPLPERPDYERVNAFLLKARRQSVTDHSVTDQWLQNVRGAAIPGETTSNVMDLTRDELPP